MPLDLAKLKEKLDESSGLGYKPYKPTFGPGKDNPAYNLVKVFSWPPQGGPTASLGKRVFIHFGLGEDGRSRALCPKTKGPGNPCPICDRIKALQQSGDPVDAQQADELTARERYYIFLADVSKMDKNAEGKDDVYVYDASPKIHRLMMQEMVNLQVDFTAWISAIGCVVGFEQGKQQPKSIDFKLAMKGLNARIEEFNQAEWLPRFPKEEDILRFRTPEQMMKMLAGEEAEAEAAAPVAKTPPVRQAPAQTPDDAVLGKAADPDWNVAEQQAPSTVSQPANQTPAPAATQPAQQATAPAQQPAPATQAAAPAKKMSIQEMLAARKAGQKV